MRPGFNGARMGMMIQHAFSAPSYQRELRLCLKRRRMARLRHFRFSVASMILRSLRGPSRYINGLLDVETYMRDGDCCRALEAMMARTFGMVSRVTQRY